MIVTKLDLFDTQACCAASQVAVTVLEKYRMVNIADIRWYVLFSVLIYFMNRIITAVATWLSLTRQAE